MLGFFAVQQRASASYELEDRLVSVPYTQVVVLGQAVAQDSFFVDSAGSVESVFDAGEEVFGAVRWGSVNYAGAGVHGDIIGEDAENFAIEERMLEVEALQLASRKVR